MIEWYGNPWSEVVKRLQSNIYSGLDEEQINPHRAQYGENKIVIPKTKSIYKLTLKQIKELWVLLTIVSILLILYMGNFLLAAAALTILIINISCIVIGEYNEEKRIKELERLNSGYARVVREGRTLKIPAVELVVGDIVIVGRGESVPADLRVIEGDELRVNETSITGENFIAEKYETKVEDKGLTLSDMKNILFKSSVVVNGNGTGIVIAVGMSTQIASVVKLLFDKKAEMPSFNYRLHKLINHFTLLISICLVCIDGVLAYSGAAVETILKTSAIFLLGGIPQGIILIITVISTILFKQMEKSSIIFKDLSTLEKFSSVSAICTDKVGSFSKDKVRAVKIYTSGVIVDADEENVFENIDEEKNQNLYRIASIGLLCNDTKTNVGKLSNPKNDLMEVALVKFGMQSGLDKRKLDREHRRVLHIPFDSERRIMTTINALDENFRANVKGAVDSLLARCTHIMKNGIEIEITEDDINAIKKADIVMSGECLSVIGFAYRNFNYEPSLKENIESNLVFVGLMGFENLLKEEAENSIKKSKVLSVKPVIITEDNKITALAVGRKMGLISKLREILSGIEIDNMAEEEFDRIGSKISVFSKINSKHKVKIIKTLNSYGYTTAMIGAKLIDLPALRSADVGITTSNSNILKKLTDIFLVDTDFMKLLDLLEDARKVMAMIRKVIVYVLTCSVSILAFTMLSSLWEYEIPFVMQEVFWFNIIIVFISSIVLLWEYKHEVPCVNQVIDKNVIKEKMTFIVSNGLLMGATAFAIVVSTYSQGVEFAKTAAFTVLNLNAVTFTYSFSKKLFFKSRLSNVLILCNLIIQLSILIFAVDMKIFLNGGYWINIGIAIVIWLLIALFRKFNKDEYYD